MDFINLLTKYLNELRDEWNIPNEIVEFHSYPKKNVHNVVFCDKLGVRYSCTFVSRGENYFTADIRAYPLRTYCITLKDNLDAGSLHRLATILASR